MHFPAQGGLHADEKAFLIALAAPESDKLDIPHLDQLPAIRRKLQRPEAERRKPGQVQAQLQQLHKPIG